MRTPTPRAPAAASAAVLLAAALLAPLSRLPLGAQQPAAPRDTAAPAPPPSADAAAIPAGPAAGQPAAAYQPGQRVEARWRSSPDATPWDRWDPAVIVTPGADGYHLVRWDSNDAPQRVEAALIRPAAGAPALPALKVGDSVQACSGSYSCLAYPAVVAEVGQGPRIAQFRVRFEDGHEKWANGYSEFPAAPAPERVAAAGRTAPATAAAPAAPPARALPAAVPNGRYWCYDGEANWRYMNQVGGGVDNHQMMGYSSHTGVVDITGPTTLRGGTQVKWQKPGAYRYDRATGRITFGAGPYDPALWSGTFGWSGSTPYFTLTYLSARHGDLVSTCVRR